MFRFSPVSLRSPLRMAPLVGGLCLLILLLSGCTSSTTTISSTPPPSTPNPTATACSVSVTDLGPGGTSKGTAPADKATGTITIDGSNGLQPLVAQAATEYLDANKDAKITVNVGGSSQGLADVEAGNVQIGMSDLFAQDVNATSYADLVDHQLGVVTFALVVNPDVAARITNLTTQQIVAIYTGQILNWKDLGGPDEAIIAIAGPSTSELMTTFRKYVLGGATTNNVATLAADTSKDVGDAVASNPGAIGYIATNQVGTKGAYQGKVVPLCIDGVKPSPTDVASNHYQFWTIEHLYTKGEPKDLTKTFLAYLTSDAFQKNDLVSQYFMQASQLSSSATASHTP
jgi:phosphate transport system substrate-binding protein